MASVTVDGLARTITIGTDGPQTVVRAAAIYSEWKRYVHGDEANWVEAFSDSIGNVGLGGALVLPGYFFFRNDLGWRLLSVATDQEIRVEGNLYGADPDVPLYNPTAGHTVNWVFERSAQAQGINLAELVLAVSQLPEDIQQKIIPHIWAAAA